MDIKKSKITQLNEERTSLNIQPSSKESYKWLQQKIRDIGNNNAKTISRTISKEKNRYVNGNNKFLMGGLYFFYYNPKHKNTLPYYDIFPLVIPLQKESDGFLGLNLHYLPLQYRIRFLDKLKAFAILNDNDEIKRLRVTYDILSNSRRYREFRPCVKKYLFNHIQSKIITVQPDEWDIATYLPVQQFRKEPAKMVWQESLKKIKES